MSFSKIRSALVQGYLDSGLALPTAYQNVDFDVPVNTPWASLFVLPNQPSVASLGAGGRDAHTGVLQVDLNHPVGTDEENILADADLLASHFTAGKRLVYNGQEVVVRSCGRSNGRKVDGWYRISMTINWYAQTPRS